MQDLAIDQHAPWQVRRLAPELAVDEVADAPCAEADCRQWRGEIEDVGDMSATSPREERHGDHDSDESAMEGHAALPDPDDVERVLADRVEAIDQDPAEPAADDHADRREENEVV